MALNRLAYVLTSLLVACGDHADPVEECPGEGDPDMVVTPSLFNYPPLEDGAHVPVYTPSQGGVFTELDLDITGVAKDDLSALLMTVRLDGGDVIGMTIPTMNFESLCQDDGSVRLELQPLALNVEAPEDLDQAGAALIVEMQLKGELPALVRDYDVVLDRRTLN